MPLVRIDLLKGKPASYKKAICDGVYRALRETFNVPEEDRFIVVSEHEAENLVFSRSYMGIARDDDFVVIQLTVSNTRQIEQKKALYAKIVALLGEAPGLKPGNVFINLVQVTTEDWSFGNGLAQYVM
ncbi:MAG: YusQ-like protein [Pseudolabrys sp.]|jgi:phenylpyruvate tautomerase PptA (4-oxalocrotonate tautomerase family)|nr:YusQ-like protein [Pseudolabrys sp.]